jgi:hypothetical protein
MAGSAQRERNFAARARDDETGCEPKRVKAGVNPNWSKPAGMVFRIVL